MKRSEQWQDNTEDWRSENAPERLFCNWILLFLPARPGRTSSFMRLTAYLVGEQKTAIFGYFVFSWGVERSPDLKLSGARSAQIPGMPMAASKTAFNRSNLCPTQALQRVWIQKDFVEAFSRTKRAI